MWPSPETTKEDFQAQSLAPPCRRSDRPERSRCASLDNPNSDSGQLADQAEPDRIKKRPRRPTFRSFWRFLLEHKGLMVSLQISEHGINNMCLQPEPFPHKEGPGRPHPNLLEETTERTRWKIELPSTRAFQYVRVIRSIGS